MMMRTSSSDERTLRAKDEQKGLRVLAKLGVVDGSVVVVMGVFVGV